MADDPTPFAIIEKLIDRWCDRRALKPLRHLLPVYPLNSVLSDGWFQLYRGLKDVKVFCKDELLPDESEMLRTAMNLIADALDRSAGKGSWHV